MHLNNVQNLYHCPGLFKLYCFQQLALWEAMNYGCALLGQVSSYFFPFSFGI